MKNEIGSISDERFGNFKICWEKMMDKLLQAKRDWGIQYRLLHVSWHECLSQPLSQKLNPGTNSYFLSYKVALWEGQDGSEHIACILRSFKHTPVQ